MIAQTSAFLLHPKNCRDKPKVKSQKRNLRIGKKINIKCLLFTFFYLILSKYRSCDISEAIFVNIF